MKQNYLIKFLFLIFVFSFLYSCSWPTKDKDGDGVADDKDKCPLVYAKTKDGCPLVKEINHINFYMETSASMAGYYSGNTDFIKMIPNLLVDVENRINFKKPLRINFISDRIYPYQGSTHDFIHSISTAPTANSRSSEMHKMFDLITQQNDTNDISIFASDCILSYSDKDIINNPEINVEKADGELKAFIKDAFLKMKSKNISATVYAFRSKFFGTYFNYRNGRFQLNGNVIRPYYLWVIGDKDLVQSFNNQLQDISGFNPDMEIDFGAFDKPISDFYLLFKTEKSGTWKSDKNQITGIKVENGNPCRFAIALDLKKIPNYSQDIEYLTNKIILNCDNMKCGLVSIKKVKDFDLSKAAPNEKINLGDKTHIFVFNISEINMKTTTLSISLPLIYNTEYFDWSTMDDININNINGKTFAFQHLVDGVRDAYQDKAEYFINISINIKK